MPARRCRYLLRCPTGFARDWLVGHEEARRDVTREALASVDEHGAVVGLALAPHIDRAGGEVELGYVVAREARGLGVATELLARLTPWAFDEAGALRIVPIIDVENAGSERVAERCGYAREGVMRLVHFKPGRRGDAACGRGCRRTLAWRLARARRC